MQAERRRKLGLPPENPETAKPSTAQVEEKKVCSNKLSLPFNEINTFVIFTVVKNLIYQCLFSVQSRAHYLSNLLLRLNI